ncbi:MAG: diaminopimelate dehydrogenase [Clostridia bacterium]|nr:diaminopimelate dehydrogenase [Clostridia bacterium]
MINVGIVGYGNLGKGVLKALSKASDMNLVGVFTKREPSSLGLKEVNVYGVDSLKDMKGQIDVLFLCGGSATDLPETTAIYLKDFNTVDSFDTHAKIPEYFEKLDKIAKENGTVSAISIGWDPGVFSIARMLFGAILPDGDDYTFWGKGVSQGHSNAIRKIAGVKNAIQYTVPIQDALDKVRSGVRPNLTTGDKHLRECFVAVEEGADKTLIEQQIKTMPNYFADYTTIVNFVSNEEVVKMQQKLNHGGFVLRSGSTSSENKDLLELSLNLDSNPEFTASVLVAYGRAVSKLSKEGKSGAFTVFDIPLKYLSDKPEEFLRKTLL